MNEVVNKLQSPEVPAFQPASIVAMTHDDNISQAHEIDIEEIHSQHESEQIRRRTELERRHKGVVVLRAKIRAKIKKI